MTASSPDTKRPGEDQNALNEIGKVLSIAIAKVLLNNSMLMLYRVNGRFSENHLTSRPKPYVTL